MLACAYVYCRAPLGPNEALCPRCGHPRDAAALRDPGFFLARTAALSLPEQLLDLHQILPVHPRVEAYQLLAMDQLRIRSALLQSAPDEATSLQGNQALAEVAARHPGRFWVSQFVDPRDPGAIDALARIAADGHRVVKLIPATGWQPDAPEFDAFWAEMEARRLVAMVHTGFITARHKDEERAAGAWLSSRCGDPLFFDRPCRRFPELTVILCHMGGAIYAEQAAEMVSQHDHVWGDVAASGVFALQRLLRGASVDWTKVFWGNDGPPFTYPLNLALHLHTLGAAGAEALAGPLLHDNGARFAERHLL